jgi:hypothetical protein
LRSLLFVLYFWHRRLDCSSSFFYRYRFRFSGWCCCCHCRWWWWWWWWWHSFYDRRCASTIPTRAITLHLVNPGVYAIIHHGSGSGA